ncbi:MAG: DUF4835 family protein [Crocinitomicaceae bacterium]|nr:DUF4835 family protein [Crocinitomicaceae bacterium]
MKCHRKALSTGKCKFNHRVLFIIWGYNTVLFNFEDQDISFNYLRNTAILFSIDQYRDNLSSILAFYAYMIIAYDYDSFELKGGTKYFNKAQTISANAKNSGDPGWSASAGRKTTATGWLIMPFNLYLSQSESLTTTITD